MESIETAELFLGIAFFVLQIVYFIAALCLRKKFLAQRANEKKGTVSNIFVALGAGACLVFSSFLLFTVIENLIIDHELQSVHENIDKNKDALPKIDSYNSDSYCKIDDWPPFPPADPAARKAAEAEAVSKYGKEYVEECKIFAKAVNDTGRNLGWLFGLLFCIVYCPVVFGLLCLKDKLTVIFRRQETNS